MSKFKIGDRVLSVSEYLGLGGWEGVVTAIGGTGYVVDFGGDEWLMAEEEIEASK